MSGQSRRIAAEVKRSSVIGDRFAIMADRIHQLSDSKYEDMTQYELAALSEMEQKFLSLARARKGTR